MKQLRALASVAVVVIATLELAAQSPAGSEDQSPKPETAGRYLILDAPGGQEHAERA